MKSRIREFKNWGFVVIAMLAAMLSSCSSDESSVEQQQQPAGVKTYTMTVQASKGGDGTRALSLDGKTLNATWAKGEAVTVYNETKKAALTGTLVAQSSGASTTLKGSLTGTIANGDELLLKFLSPSYSSQDGTLEYIAAHCDYAEATVEVTNASTASVTTTDASFVNKQAIVKFTLNKGDGTTAVNATSLVVGVGSSISYTVTPATATNVLFVAVPGISDKDFTLTASVSGDTYFYEKESVTFEDGKYYEIGVKMKHNIEIASAQELIAFATAYNNGDYDADGSALIVKLMGNISFDATSNAAFNDAGGIGKKDKLFGANEDYYFSGTFDGNERTISGLTATVPLFAATSENSTIKDLTIDESCSFTFTHPNTTDLYAGAVVGYHKGTMNNVDVEADVSIVAGEISQVTALGGLVGRVAKGTIDNCSYSGNITVPDGYAVASKRTYVGGLVGEISNAAGIVQNSDFEGTIDFAGTVASTDSSNPYLLLGGIVGSNIGSVVDCSTSATKTKEITMDNSTSYTATIQNHTRKAYHLAQGGIAGENSGTVSNCTNNASTKNFVLTTGTNGGSASDSNSRYYDLGGIVGLNKAGGTVSGCNNNGLIESRSTPRTQKIGGVVGYNKGTVSSSSNNSSGTILITGTSISPYSLRVGEVGGVIGNNEGSVSDIHNAGNISMDRTENHAGVELKFGGVIGVTTTTIDGGAGKSITNSGNITDSYNGKTVSTAGLRFGGIVGSAQASVKNATNSGDVTYQTSSENVVSRLYMGGIAGEIRSAVSAQVSGCENSGEIYFNVANNAEHTGNYVGGIIGFTFESNVAISGCSNSGYIHGGNPSKKNGTTMYVGGIVAYLDGASSIANCDNTGQLLNNQYNNTNSKDGSTYEGGIAGYVKGTDDDRISISYVTNNYNNGATITGPKRGYGGGIVGYAEFTDIASAENSNSFSGGSGYWIGGIAGWLVNGTITNSTFTGTSIESGQIQGAGGIVCTLDAGSTIDGCISYLNSITHGANACVDGDIAAKSVAGSIIQNCHYTNTYGICSDSYFTDGGGNKADL